MTVSARNTVDHLARFVSSTWGRRLVLTVAIVGSLLAVFGIPGVQSWIPYRVDLDVYRLGGAALLNGQELYGELPPTSSGIHLPFTYPPAAAILFVPFALIPMWAANILLTTTTLVALWVTQSVVLKELAGGNRQGLVWWTMCAYAFALTLGPVNETIGYGQINGVLMALVTVDALVGRNKPWRGSLVGLALAIKLTPAVFLAYFLIKKDWRALANAAISAAVVTGVGFLFAGSSSVQYWTTTLFDPSRIGGLAYVSNQSINGALARFAVEDHRTIAWFLICAVIGVACLWIMRQLFDAGQDVAALLVMSFFSLLASPVSWSHHWIWVAPTLLVFFAWCRNKPTPWLIALSAAGVAIFVSQIIWKMPQGSRRELDWVWWQHLLGNAQTLWGIAAIVALWWWGSRQDSRAQVTPATRTVSRV